MKVLIAPNAFKGSLSAMEAADIIEEAIYSIDSQIETIKLPIADGGDGFTEIMTKALNGNLITCKVQNALGNEIEAQYGWINKKTAIIGVASASGIALLDKEKLTPLQASSYGTGQLIADAINRGCQEIIIGLGGSATSDGGMGILSALGVDFLDINGEKVKQGGGNLSTIADIHLNGLEKKIKDIEIFIASDVENKLLGENGAAKIYAPQKGATETEVDILEYNLSYFANIVELLLQKDMKNIIGGGAAGGIGAGLTAFMEAEIYSGMKLVMNTLQLERQLKEADIFITGEGAFDKQSLSGKGAGVLVRKAKELNKPALVFAGKITYPLPSGLDSHCHAFSIVNTPSSLEEILPQSKKLLYHTVREVFKLMKFKSQTLFKEKAE